MVVFLSFIFQSISSCLVYIIDYSILIMDLQTTSYSLPHFALHFLLIYNSWPLLLLVLQFQGTKFRCRCSSKPCYTSPRWVRPFSMLNYIVLCRVVFVWLGSCLVWLNFADGVVVEDCKHKWTQTFGGGISL